MSHKELEGKIAVVTGGTKGIGKAIADKLSLAGATVIVTARTAAKDINPDHHFIQADLSVAENIKHTAERMLGQFGHIDILVNNMGGNNSPGGGYSVLTDEHWDQDLQLNLMASVRLDRALLPHLIERKRGVIIHISSSSALMPLWEATMSYSASKAALNAYSKALAAEVGSHDIRVITVSPGTNKTKSMMDFIEDLASKSQITADEMTGKLLDRLGGVPLGRMADPKETADLVCFLASPRASYITGTNYVIDGGNLPVV